MPTFNNYHLILEEIDNTLSHLEDNDYGRFANEVVGASRIFTAGKVALDMLLIALQCV